MTASTRFSAPFSILRIASLISSLSVLPVQMFREHIVMVTMSQADLYLHLQLILSPLCSVEEWKLMYKVDYTQLCFIAYACMHTHTHTHTNNHTKYTVRPVGMETHPGLGRAGTMLMPAVVRNAQLFRRWHHILQPSAREGWRTVLPASCNHLTQHESTGTALLQHPVE